MVDRKELSDHLLDLAELANQRFITRKDLVAFPIIGAGAGIIRYVLQPSGIDTIDNLLSATTMGTSMITGVLIGMDLIKERITQRAIDQIKKAKTQ